MSDRQAFSRRRSLALCASSLGVLGLALAGFDPPEGLAAQPPQQARELIVDMPAVAGEPSAPVLAVYTSDHGFPPRVLGPQVLLAFWSDGRAVWSTDELGGGPPYREGRVAPDRVRKLLDAQAAKGVFGDNSLNRAHFGPHARFTVIAVADGRRRLCMCSWHELFEADPKIIVTASGVEPLAGRDRAEVQAAQPQEYRRFRQTWADLRAGIRDLTPAEGRRAEGLTFELRRLPPADGGK